MMLLLVGELVLLINGVDAIGRVVDARFNDAALVALAVVNVVAIVLKLLVLVPVIIVHSIGSGTVSIA